MRTMSRWAAAFHSRTVEPYFAWSHVFTQGLVIVLACGSTASSSAVLVVLAAVGLVGSTWSLKALSLFVVVKYLNPSLAAFSSVGATLLWATPIAAAMRLTVAGALRPSPLLLAIWLFCGFAALVAPLISPAPAVSVMKAVTFCLVITPLIATGMSLSDEGRRDLFMWIRGLAVVVSILSLSTLMAPSIAFMSGTRLLRGILNHSQALAALLAPVVAAGVAGLMTRPAPRMRWEVVCVVLLSCCLISTNSRTGVLAAFLAVVAAISFQRFENAESARRARTKIVVMLGFAGVSAALAVALSDAPAAAFRQFFIKREAGSFSAAFDESRGANIAGHVQAFLQSPVVGHGFGVFPDGEFPVGVTRVMGIPVSAPVEKGFLPTAVLEETGLIGATLLALIIMLLIRASRARASAMQGALLFGALLVNLGEAVFFSPTGMGLYIWVLIAAAVVGQQRIGTNRQTSRQPNLLP